MEPRIELGRQATKVGVKFALRSPARHRRVRAVWLNEIVINQIEIRPMAVESLEFDAAGEAEISFIAIKPGTHILRIPGSTGETQQVKINIR